MIDQKFYRFPQALLLAIFASVLSSAPAKAMDRSEIAIRVFRAANELGLKTVAAYAQEDKLALHRSNRGMA